MKAIYKGHMVPNTDQFSSEVSLNLPRWGDSVIESQCPSVCLFAPLDAVFFKASHWP